MIKKVKRKKNPGQRRKIEKYKEKGTGKNEGRRKDKLKQKGNNQTCIYFVDSYNSEFSCNLASFNSTALGPGQKATGSILPIPCRHTTSLLGLHQV